MLSSLKRDFRIITIGVHANMELCVRRINERDQSIHIPFSEEEMINDINLRVSKKWMDTDYEICNTKIAPMTPSKLKSETCSNQLVEILMLVLLFNYGKFF